MCQFIYDDGGRMQAGFKGSAGDCVVRSIAIATNKSYKKVYEEINILCKDFNVRHNGKYKDISSRTGVSKKVYHNYLLNKGFKWIPLMRIGKGCTVHLVKDELPNGVIICRLSKHLTTVINGVIHDTYNPNELKIFDFKNKKLIDRDTNRCVYGYYAK